MSNPFYVTVTVCLLFNKYVTRNGKFVILRKMEGNWFYRNFLILQGTGQNQGKLDIKLFVIKVVFKLKSNFFWLYIPQIIQFPTLKPFYIPYNNPV